MRSSPATAKSIAATALRTLSSGTKTIPQQPHEDQEMSRSLCDIRSPKETVA
ncbi:MAG: hypothetical protein SGPRY_014124 [Prymnesium sp.]